LARHAVIPERSRVQADARSSLHPIRMETAGFQGFVEADLVDGQPRLGLPTHIELPVSLLRSGNALLDSELQRRLEARKHPRVEGDLREVTPLAPGRWLLRGDLLLHGISRPMEVEVSVRTAGDGTLEIEGEKTIDMRDFGLTPPKILFLKVDPQVRVRARLVAKA
jgi:polyisoprenoid-binding protein YceI